MEHIGSAQQEARLELFKRAFAQQRLAAMQSELDLGIARPDPTAARDALPHRCAIRVAVLVDHLVTIGLVYEPGALGSAFDVLAMPDGPQV